MSDKCIVYFFSAGRTYASFQGTEEEERRRRRAAHDNFNRRCSTACRKANVAGAFRPGDRTESTVTCEQLVSLKQIDKAFF